MSWLLSVVLGLVCSVVGAVGAGLLAGLLIVDWYRISSFEGRSSYFVVFIGLVGGLVGIITGIVCARIVAASPEPGLLAALWLATKSLGGMLAICALFTYLGAPPAPVPLVELGPPAQPVEQVSTPDEPRVLDTPADAAPLADWLPLTRYGTPPERMTGALIVMRARADLTEQLRPLLHATDSTTQSDALRVLELLPEQAPAFALDVHEVGQQLVDAITRFNVSAPADDPRFEAAADVSVRFSAWMVAVRALRAHAMGDFGAELRAIAAAARVRGDSHVMQEDVRRVADHYAREWNVADASVGP